MFHNSYQIPQQPLSRNNCSISFYRELSGPSHCSWPACRGPHRRERRPVPGRPVTVHCALIVLATPATALQQVMTRGVRQTSCAAVEPAEQLFSAQHSLYCAACSRQLCSSDKDKGCSLSDRLTIGQPAAQPGSAPRLGCPQ